MRALLAVALSVLAATPQRPAPLPSLGETIEVSIVNVDVFVTDRAGNRVTGLTRDDFEIFEDGKLRPISNFAEYHDAIASERVSATPDATQPAAAPPAETTKRQKLTMVIFAEALELRPDQQRAVYGQVRDTLRHLVQPGDAVAVVGWKDRSAPRIWVPFTDDVAKLDAALDEASRQPAVAAPDLQAMALEAAYESEAGSFKKRDHIVRYDDSLEGQVAKMEERRAMKAKAAALNSLIAVMGAAEGQRALVMLTRRFGVASGNDRLPANAEAQPEEADLMPYVESVASAANANGVRIYAVYPQELESGAVQGPDNSIMPSTTAASFAGRGYLVAANQLGGLQIVAERTGGEMTWHPTEAIRLLQRIPDDFHAYYSLAFRATTTSVDKVHKIAVKVKKPGLTVRSRTQFVERSDETKMNERVTARLFSIDTAAVPRIPLRVRMGELRRSGRKSVLPVTVEVPIAALTALPQGATSAGAFTVYVGWSNGLGQIGDVTHRTQPFSIPRGDLKRAGAGHFTYDLDVMVDGRTNRIAVGVLDEVSREFGLETVDVHAAGDLAKSP